MIGGAALVIALAVAGTALLTAGGGRPVPARAGPPGGHPVPTRAGPLPAQPPPATEQFGVNTGLLFNHRAYTPAQIDAQIAALRQTGATVVRSDALWEATEPSPPVGGVHHYDWGFDDQIAGALAAHGLRWLPIVDYSAAWAQSIPGQDHSPPARASDFAAYAAALAGRYGPGGSFWAGHPSLPPEPVDTYEIWNEPDNPAFWSPTPDADAYANLYALARDAIDAVQPEARVIIGGLTHPATFMPELLSASPELRGHIDGVGIHPYGANPLAVLGAVRAARLALDSLGLGAVPLYVTEFGWTTLPPGAMDWAAASRRPAYITQTLTALGHTDCGIAEVLLYTWVTPERDPTNAQDWFGIASPAGGSTPDSQAFAAGLAEAGAPAATLPLCA